MADEDREEWQPPERRRRRPELEPSYEFLSREDMERAVREGTARFLSQAEIEKLIDQRSGQRWRNAGLAVSANPYEPGLPEENLRTFFGWGLSEHTKDKDRKSKPFAGLLIAVQLVGGVSTFGAIMWAIISFFTGHFAWKN